MEKPFNFGDRVLIISTGFYSGIEANVIEEMSSAGGNIYYKIQVQAGPFTTTILRDPEELQLIHKQVNHR